MGVGGWGSLQDGGEHLGGSLALEGMLAGQQLVDEHAHLVRVRVGVRVGVTVEAGVGVKVRARVRVGVRVG